MERLLTEQFLGRLPELEVLVVGDLMLDEYLWGRAERISPEAPVAVVDVQQEDSRLGGAGNVINNALSLGAGVAVASVVGDDEDGAWLLERLRSKGLAIDGVLIGAGRKTSRKTRVLASNQQMVRIDRESREEITADLEVALIDFVENNIGRFAAILVSDYGKGVLTETVLRRVIQLAKQQGIPVVVDPKGEDYSKYRGATLLTPNRKEVQLATGELLQDESSLLKAGRQLRQTLDLDALALTRSEEGMSLFLREDGEVHLPTEAREVFDVSGAGDTVLTVLGLGLAAGLALTDSAQLSNIAAGVVVAKVGTSPISAEELRAACALARGGVAGKIFIRTDLQPLLAAEQAAGRQVVFTNGCFDLLHVGHVKYLQKARQLGDLLVLGLNSDASIQRLKGPKRPLIGQDERAHIMAALDCIDYVTLFDEDTPLELLEVLRPDILVKGGDYTPEGVVGRELVESGGGRVELIQFVDGKSTTNIIERILEAYQDEL